MTQQLWGAVVRLRGLQGTSPLKRLGVAVAQGGSGFGLPTSWWWASEGQHTPTSTRRQPGNLGHIRIDISETCPRSGLGGSWGEGGAV